MDLHELKKKTVRDTLKIDDSFGKIFSFIDFGNVNYWFGEDEYDSSGKILDPGKKLIIDIEKLNDFARLFSDDIRFYYGLDNENAGSFGFIRKARYVFGKNRVFTKPIQKVRHYLDDVEIVINTRAKRKDGQGPFVLLPKCNFDVEICVDAIKTDDKYNTFCLFSGDADFVHLARFLKGKGKKIILAKGGYIHHSLYEVADLVISAQDIKSYITAIKQKPGC
ncbi:MAG: NYN domain-containing protein [Candidatus Portnoybacteria bacterium]|nr:NYN domain-containing protein [Candidatus Portnoybacteria bacterium]